MPLVTGHEFSGVIADVGSAVTRFQPGQRVSGEGHLTCGACRNCRAGRRQMCIRTIGLGVQRDGAFAPALVHHLRDVAQLIPARLKTPCVVVAHDIDQPRVRHVALHFLQMEEALIALGVPRCF